jgi:hypothetical protein
VNPRQNPFAPGAGTQPPELAGRQQILADADILLDRIQLRRPSRSQIFVGLRGVGKTVLLNRVRELAEGKSFHAVMVEAHEDKSLPALLIPPLRKVLLRLDAEKNLSEKTKTGLRVLRSFIGRFKAKVKVGELAELELGVNLESRIVAIWRATLAIYSSRLLSPLRNAAWRFACLSTSFSTLNCANSVR